MMILMAVAGMMRFVVGTVMTPLMEGVVQI